MYHKALGLNELPFRLEADPRFFYRSSEHNECLQRLKLAVALQKGCSVILGDIGNGKTTLAETLRLELAKEEKFIIRKILNPTFKTEFQFLKELCGLFGLDSKKSTLDYNNSLREFLFNVGVKQNKITILIIDEGQKLTLNYLEILRLLLNYQTPKFFLLNLIIFAQLEFLHKLRRKRSFEDRIALKFTLNPLNKEETKNMILFRLKVAGANNPASFFTEEVIENIYFLSEGRPRKISFICSNLLEEAVIHKHNLPIDKEFLEKWKKKTQGW